MRDDRAAGRGLFAGAVAASVLAAFAVMIAGDATAQDRGVRGSAGAARFGEPQRRSDEADAARLYADAREDLDGGHRESAQRLLELLVARFPDSAIATVARRDLVGLYAPRAGSPAVSGRTTPPGAVSPIFTPLPAGPLPLPAGPLPLPAAAPLPLPAAVPLPLLAATPSPLPAAPVARGTNSSTEPAAILRAADDFRATAGDRVFFADSSADLGSRARAALEAQAAWLARYPAATISLEGHADDRGNGEQNRILSEQRADIVRQRLIDLGIGADRIAAVGLGREQPVAACPDPSCAAQNRRVVTVLTRVPQAAGGGSARESRQRAADAMPAGPGMATTWR